MDPKISSSAITAACSWMSISSRWGANFSICHSRRFDGLGGFVGHQHMGAGMDAIRGLDFGCAFRAHTQVLPQIGTGKPFCRAASSIIILTPAEKPMIFRPREPSPRREAAGEAQD